MEENQPFVSIVVPVFNTGVYVIHTLESIYNQSYPLNQLEVVIMDDGSTDNSTQLLELWIEKHSKLKCFLHKNKENKGLNTTLNIAIKMFVKHEYLILIGDDVFLPDRINLQLEEFKKDKSVGLCFSDMEIIDADGQLLHPSYYFNNYKIDVKDLKTENLYERMLSSNIIPAPSIMHRKSVIEEMGYFDEELTFEDYDMNLRILRNYNAAFIPKSLVQYRVMDNSMSKDIYRNIKHIKSYFLIYEKHLDYQPSYLYVVGRMNWFLEKMYVSNVSNLLSFSREFLETHCKEELLKSCILRERSVLFFRIKRKLNNW